MVSRDAQDDFIDDYLDDYVPAAQRDPFSKKGAQSRRNKRTPTEIARDRALIARLHYTGLNDTEITDALNSRPEVQYSLSRRQITHDRNSMLQQWQGEQLQNTDQWVAEATAELAAVRAAAWEAYDKSLGPSEKLKYKQALTREGDVVDLQEKVVEQGIGDVNHLRVVIEATREMNRLRGLYEVKLRIDQRTTSEVVVKAYHRFSPDMWDDPRIQVVDGEVIGQTPEIKQLGQGDGDDQ